MKILTALLAIFGVGVLFAPAALAHDFGPPPPHTQRISAQVFRVDPGWYETVKAAGICPGSANEITHEEKQKDKSTLVVCEESTYFTPEVPNLKAAQVAKAPVRYLTRTVVRTVKVPTDKVVTHVRTTPVLFLTILYLIIGVVVGTIAGSVLTLTKLRRSW